MFYSSRNFARWQKVRERFKGIEGQESQSGIQPGTLPKPLSGWDAQGTYGNHEKQGTHWKSRERPHGLKYIWQILYAWWDILENMIWKSKTSVLAIWTPEISLPVGSETPGDYISFVNVLNFIPRFDLFVIVVLFLTSQSDLFQVPTPGSNRKWNFTFSGG